MTERLPINEALRFWTAGLGLGARLLPRSPALGIKRLILPVSYWRTVEFAYVARHIKPAPAHHVLDVGSPKELAIFLARSSGCTVTATDILEHEVVRVQRYASAENLDGNGSGRIVSETQDGRCLRYPDSYFDAVYSVSVLEHIPGAGDSEAIRELTRVVKPGGLVVVTVPFATRYHETFVHGAVYERKPTDGEAIFFERHYDEASLDERLLRPSGAMVVDRQVWGEGKVRMEHHLRRLGKLAWPVSPAEAFLSAICLRQIAPGASGHPMTALVTLRKVAKPEYSGALTDER